MYIEMTDIKVNDHLLASVVGEVLYDFNYTPDYTDGAMEDAEPGSTDVEITHVACQLHIYEKDGQEVLTAPLVTVHGLLSFVNESELVEEVCEHELTG